MLLPFFKKNSSAPAREYFFVLQIDALTVKSAVWTVANGKPQVLAVSNRYDWDGQQDHSLIQACDRSLTDSSQHLDPSGSVQPQKVIFGLPPDWVGEEKVSPLRLKLLRTLTEKLSLTAVGYVVTPQALSRYMQSTEGVPITAILLGVWPRMLEVTLVRLGKIDHTVFVTRSSQIIADVIEGLSRFSHVDMLPSRIFLYDSGLDLEEVRQTLLSHPWQAPQTRLPFLHFPKIDVLPQDFTVKAIALASGEEVAEAMGLIPSTVSPVRPAPVTPRDLGFSLNEDVVADPVPAPSEETFRPDHQVPPARGPSGHRRLSLPRIRLPRLPASPLLFLIALILVAVGLFTSYWYLPKATVSLSVAPRTLEHQFILTASASTTVVDVGKALLPARTIEATVSDDKSNPATGTKLIGDKATGSVTVINGTSVPRTFPSGTVISSPSGLKFVLDADVAIASASGTADPNSYQPGKSAVKVTASQIGSDSNISAGTQFKIGTFAALDFVAKNDAAFSGGSSQQVKAVAKDDLAGLRTELSSSLKDQAKDDLAGQITDAQILIPESVELQTVSEEASHKVDEVADELTLRLTVKAKGLVLAKQDLDELISGQVEPLIPEGFNSTGDVRHSFQVKETTKDSASFDVSVRADLLPDFDSTRVARDLAGKFPAQARDYLQSLQSVSSVDFKFFPHFPSRILTLPHIPDRINIVVQPVP